MQLVHWGYVGVAAVCLTVAVQHGMVAVRLRERWAWLLFALTSVAAGADALVQHRFLNITSIAEGQQAYAWTAVSIGSFVLFLVWFVNARTGAMRRWLLWTVSGLVVANAAIDFILPAGMPAFVHVTSVREVVLPWGEVIHIARGTPAAWRLIGDVANVAFLVLLFDTTTRLARRGRRREAFLIGGSLLAIGVALLLIIPTDLGLIDMPLLHPFAFLLVIAGMSWDLSDRVLQAATLSREVVRGESHWRQLVENAPLLVVVMAPDGRLRSVNPRYLAVTGRRRDEVVGRPFRDLAPASDRDRAEAAFGRALDGSSANDPVDAYEGEVTTSVGGRRVVSWRSVLLRDGQGAVEAILSLGEDVTARRDAERKRAETQRDLEHSVRDLENMRARLEEENLLLRDAVGQEDGHRSIIGSSPVLMYVLHKVQHAAPTGVTILLSGETGVGKELVARMIHQESGRKEGPFIAVNCGALPVGLLESELFGHERGAFTGADRRRRGRFELADGGTLFLDEITELPVELQPRLLRVLQEGQFERVGDEKTRDVDVRIIATTNRDLPAEVAAGRFRQDLYYRLDVFPITIPPLRDRVEDIPLLVQHFVRLISVREGIRVDEVPQEVLRHLSQHHWPGNIRELRNVVERAVLQCTDGVLRLVEPLVGRTLGLPGTDGRSSGLRPTLGELERDYIRQVLAECDGQVAGTGGAAETLGIHPNTLRSRMQKLGLGSLRNSAPAPKRLPHDH